MTLSCYLESTLTSMCQICNVVSLFRVDFDGNVTNLTRCLAIKSRLWRQCDKFVTLSCYLESTLTTMWQIFTLSRYLESTLTTMWQIYHVVSLLRVDFDDNVTNFSRCLAIKSRLWRHCEKFFTLSRYLESTLTAMCQTCHVVSLLRVDFDDNLTNLSRCRAI